MYVSARDIGDSLVSSFCQARGGPKWGKASTGFRLMGLGAAVAEAEPVESTAAPLAYK